MFFNSYGDAINPSKTDEHFSSNFFYFGPEGTAAKILESIAKKNFTETLTEYNKNNIDTPFEPHPTFKNLAKIKINGIVDLHLLIKQLATIINDLLNYNEYQKLSEIHKKNVRLTIENTLQTLMLENANKNTSVCIQKSYSFFERGSTKQVTVDRENKYKFALQIEQPNTDDTIHGSSKTFIKFPKGLFNESFSSTLSNTLRLNFNKKDPIYQNLLKNVKDIELKQRPSSLIL